MKQLIKSLVARTPYRIVRRGKLNRFQAIEESLASLTARGFRPTAVIDGGANTGVFARTALKLFPDAVVHVIEPQPSCGPVLHTLSNEFPGRIVVHMFALCAPEDEGRSLSMVADTGTISTGAHIAVNGEGLSVPSWTLDRLLVPHAPSIEGALLKLDLQGYELHALKGATETLRQTDVILSEVSFFAQAYEPPISALVEFLANHGFELYDVASIYARPRDDRPRQGDFIFIKSESQLVDDKAWS